VFLFLQDHKKNVSFKRQKYHSVYEYPRETSDSDSEGFDSPTHQHWNSLVLQSTQQPQVDYSSFAGLRLLIIIKRKVLSVTTNDVY
jgi:hypothetical protein